MKHFMFWVLACFCFASPVAARKNKIFLNGTPIPEVRNQLFKNVSVRIDSQGHVHILGKQYSVRAKEKKLAQETPTGEIKGKIITPPRVEVGPRPTNKYVLLIQRSATFASGYALRVKINGRLALRVSLNTEQDVIDVTPFLKKGDNEIIIAASKMKANTGGTLTLKIYPGKIIGGQVRIKDKIKLNYVRKGSEKNNFRHIMKTYIP